MNELFKVAKLCDVIIALQLSINISQRNVSLLYA